jgi:predicted DNA-binding protein (MmcQ/YjbR family)
MDLEQFRNFCLSLKATEETQPFGPETVVYKVGGKVYAIAFIDDFKTFNVKCDPEQAIELRERYEQVQPGYHMSKKHWNTIMVDGRIKDTQLQTWIKDSYQLVYNALPKKVKMEIDLL